MWESSKSMETATVKEMIHRFRTAPPTSRAVREAMRFNGDAPTRMWYEKKDCNLVENDVVETTVMLSSSLSSTKATKSEKKSTSLSTSNKGVNQNGNGGWRQQFKNKWNQEYAK